jgi:hypothetical protein
VTEDDEAERKRLVQLFFDPHRTDVEAYTSLFLYLKRGETKIDALRTKLMQTLPTRVTYSPEEKKARSFELEEGKPPQSVSEFVDRLCSFLIAALGGLFLIRPMLIMTIHPSKKKSLITVSASVVLFIVMLTFGVRVTNAEALVSTATYAAILVVFVGSSTWNN